MQNEIANKVFEMLEQVAEQLGVAAEKLYPILLKQAKIDGIVNIIGLIVLIIITYFSVRFAIKKYRKDVNEFDELTIEGFVLSVFAFLSTICLIVELSLIKTTILTPLLNPDWYILNELLANLIK